MNIAIKGNKKTCRAKTCRCPDRKEQIIAMSRNIIFSEGFGNFTVRRVASGVGVSEAAIYRHFASKEELLLALLNFLFEPWRKAIEELIKLDCSSLEKLVKLIQLHLHHLLEKQLNPMLFFSEAIHPDNVRLIDSLKMNVGFLQKSVEKILQTGIKKGEIDGQINVAAAVACVVGILQTNVIRWTITRSEEGLETKAMEDMRFLTSLFGKKE